MGKALFVEVRQRGGGLEQTQRDVPTPPPGHVRIKVEACGICRGDELCLNGHWPGVSYPRVPGHEVVGIVDALGAGVDAYAVGQRVGAGWAGGNCQTCDDCKRGRTQSCRNGLINGLLTDGGYSQYMIVPSHALVRIPDECDWDSASIAPLMCAGVTVFNPLRHSGVKPGSWAAVQGIGGLGHLGIQFARKMGYRVAAISSGSGKRELSLQLGAEVYIDTSKEDAVEVLRKRGGASIILATAPDAKAISALVEALGRFGKMYVVAAPREKLEVNGHHLLGNCAAIQGWAGGSSADVEETVAFATAFGIKPMVEVFALSDADSAYQKMLSNTVRFRSVLDCR